jgi:hypothetical protein
MNVKQPLPTCPAADGPTCEVTEGTILTSSPFRKTIVRRVPQNSTFNTNANLFGGAGTGLKNSSESRWHRRSIRAREQWDRFHENRIFTIKTTIPRYLGLFRNLTNLEFEMDPDIQSYFSFVLPK